jgi:two-component system LytT family response regulator
MRIKTVIIEDEEKSLFVLTDLIKRLANDLEVVGTASHVQEAVKLLEEIEPDLVFMDVRIADGTSFDVLRKLSFRHFALIMVTAYDNYALEAIKFSAIDYLLKPVGIPNFEEAVERARKILSLKIRHNTIETLLHNLGQQGGQDKKISIPTINGYEFIELNNVIWCQSEGSYTTFHLTDKSSIISSRNIGYYAELLNNHNFCRIHNGTIIHMRFIKSYRKGKGGYVIMSDGTELEIAQRRKGLFLEKLPL